MFRFSLLSLCLVATLAGPLLSDEPPALNSKDKLIVETLLRLDEFDLDSSVKAKAALMRYLRAQPGTDQYFELIERFKITDFSGELVSFVLQHADESTGVRGAGVLGKLGQLNLLRARLTADDPDALAAATLLGHVAGEHTVNWLLPSLDDRKLPVAVRTACLVAVGRRADGQKALLKLVASSKLPDDLKFAAANALLGSGDARIEAEAAKYLELPATADSQPLPPLSELVKRTGDIAAGAVVFRTQGTCIACHKVRGEGKDVGPDLSEIGSKLSRDAMFVAILDPSAAISHNYETYTLLTDDGSTVTGLLVSDTAAAMTLRTAEGIDKKVVKESIEDFKKQTTSLMPQDLQRQMTADQLVDLVAYTMSLTKTASDPLSEEAGE
ncbi:c-type cytochrome [Aureliella helgolandensis]|uniref:Cytochrome c n=1 Tax=Aureliella helgolandensis TaxID=2527968 RepID=A0A518GC12_9BACT|nr:c-type cytochrome [Aureliella helgolandensis]QDV26097.1 Cytochrome c [Aureliella helgolandensis]